MKKILKLLSIVIMLTVATIYTMPTKVLAFGPSSNEIYNGIDVSGYQGNIDFEKVKNDGIEIVYMKSSEGTNYIDSKFEQNYKRARDAGLKNWILPLCNSKKCKSSRKRSTVFCFSNIRKSSRL